MSSPKKRPTFIKNFRKNRRSTDTSAKEVDLADEMRNLEDISNRKERSLTEYSNLTAEQDIKKSVFSEDLHTEASNSHFSSLLSSSCSTESLDKDCVLMTYENIEEEDNIDSSCTETYKTVKKSSASFVNLPNFLNGAPIISKKDENYETD